MTAPREILPGRTYSISRRCTQRQFLLRPDEKTIAIFYYCLGEAAARCNIHVVVWMAMSNHYHAVVYDPDGRLPEFLEHFHKMMARTLNALHKRGENLWASGETSVTYLPSNEDIDNKVVYVLTNPVSAHLVERVTDWPGATSIHHLDGRRTKHSRPQIFFRMKSAMPDTVELAVSLPPSITARETFEQWASRIQGRVHQREDELKAARIQSGRRIIGRKAVLNTRPFDCPSSDELRRTLSSAIAGTKRAVRTAAARALAEFHAAYRLARSLFEEGNREVVFPAGTYRFRRWGACCDPFPTRDVSVAA